jgi:tetratricopeptide (TPR) repeat protein
MATATDESEGAAGFARRAETLHLQGDSAAALRILTEGVRHHPADVTARLVLARVCRDTGRHEEARDWLEAALRADPECPAALFQLSEMLGDALGAFHRDRLAAQEPWDAGFRSGAAVNPAPASQDAVSIPAVDAFAPRPAEQRIVRRVPSPAFAFPVREDEEEPEIEENSAPHVATVTLAEIYLQQGLKEQAAQIYRQLLERQPGDDSVRRRLQEIEGT